MGCTYVAGEVSLPGGKADPSDKDDAETATREANEEIGLDRSLVNVVTVMEPFLSKVWKWYLENACLPRTLSQFDCLDITRMHCLHDSHQCITSGKLS